MLLLCNVSSLSTLLSILYFFFNLSAGFADCKTDAVNSQMSLKFSRDLMCVVTRASCSYHKSVHHFSKKLQAQSYLKGNNAISNCPKSTPSQLIKSFWFFDHIYFLRNLSWGAHSCESQILP